MDLLTARFVKENLGHFSVIDIWISRTYILAQLQPAEPAESAETEYRCGSPVVLYSASSLLVRALCDTVEDRPWSSDVKGISGF